MATEGPVWPTTFTVDFHETLDWFFGRTMDNDGRWYYDFANNRARFDHFEPQNDVFCTDQGLSANKPDDTCHLIFSPTGEMFLHYPNQKECCRYCKKGDGCTPLKPNWIEDGSYEGNEIIQGRDCLVYSKKGAEAQDYWMETEDGSPCRYYEVFTFLLTLNAYHNMTFDYRSYSLEPIADEIFDVPKYCEQDCPNPHV